MARVNLKKRGNTWTYSFEAAKVNGKRRQITKGGFKTQAEALAAGTKALNEYNNTGLTFTPSEISCTDYFNFWLENYVQKELADSTYKGYKKKIRLYIIPYIGNYKLKSITTDTLRNLLFELYNNQFSRNTLTSIKGIITAAFDYATNIGNYINVNPSIGLKLPNSRMDKRIGTRKKQKIIATQDMWNQIMQRFPENHPAHLPLCLAYHCGMRLGEVFGLTWDCVDLENKTIEINKQVQEIDKEYRFTAPKYDSFRIISISDDISSLLKRKKEMLEKAKVLYDEYYTNISMNYDVKLKDRTSNDHRELRPYNELHEVNLVNVRENGTFIQPRTMQHAFRVIHGHSNTPCISKELDFHSLRHTHATMLYEAGVPMPAIQRRLGHTNLDMTAHYTDHLTEGMRNKLLEVLNTNNLSSCCPPQQKLN